MDWVVVAIIYRLYANDYYRSEKIRRRNVRPLTSLTYRLIDMYMAYIGTIKNAKIDDNLHIDQLP